MLRGMLLDAAWGNRGGEGARTVLDSIFSTHLLHQQAGCL
jgi:hypothetical protein